MNQQMNMLRIILFLSLTLLLSANKAQSQAFKKGYAYTLTSENKKVIGYFEEAIGLPAKSSKTVFLASGPIKYSNIVLKKGLIPSRRHYNWYQSSRIGRVIQKNLILKKYDTKGNLIGQWKIQGAYPFEASQFIIKPNGTGTAAYLKYKLERCFVTSYSTSGN